MATESPASSTRTTGLSIGAKPDVVCSLDDIDLGGRVLEWGDLADSATGMARIPGGLAITAPVAIRADVEDLADREGDCCGSWLDLATSVDGDEVRLELTTSNPEGVPVIEAMVGFGPTSP